MANVMTTSGAVMVKAGANATQTMVGGIDNGLERIISGAECFLNVLTRTNYTDTFPVLNTDVKYLLDEAVSNLSAIYVITYDMSGFTSRIEAEDMINVLWARFQMIIDLIRDQKSVDFINGA